jgi:hypothetical protein
MEKAKKGSSTVPNGVEGEGKKAAVPRLTFHRARPFKFFSHRARIEKLCKGFTPVTNPLRKLPPHSHGEKIVDLCDTFHAFII